MGVKKIQIKIKTDYSQDDLRQEVASVCGISDFSFSIDKKSLDARKKSAIHWLMSLYVTSPELSEQDIEHGDKLDIPYLERDERIIVVGSGPAGFFSAFVLQKAGYKVTLLERGSSVDIRSKALKDLEANGQFSPENNYAFGEGGAGTFSDGKLTSRSKHISAERNFIISEYIRAGAPEEIRYLAHPHLGTNNLKKMIPNLRQTFIEIGGTVLFDTKFEELLIKGQTVSGVRCSQGDLSADHVILATGHSAYETYRQLMRQGVIFNTKNFALGHRIEHTQKMINRSQWGITQLPGVKAAEYRLTAKTSGGMPVFTFCMCPGGRIVPAAAYAEKSLVNGMSYYARDGHFANSACVVGVHPDQILGQDTRPDAILDWMDDLESKFYQFSSGYTLPAIRADQYLSKKMTAKLPRSSYPLGLEAAPLHSMLPASVASALKEGLGLFDRKLQGFSSGTLMGLESKTSSPIQVARNREGLCRGFENLYMVGEGSGYAGGIISSAADGIRCAMGIFN